MGNKVRIKFGQIEFEAEGDSDLIERERQQFFNLLPNAIAAVTPVVATDFKNINELEDASLIESIGVENNISNNEEILKHKFENISTLIREKKISNGTDIVMGVAYYLDIIKDIGPLNTNDITQTLNEARQPKLSNVNSFVNNNIKKGYLTEHIEKKDSLKAFRVTSNGIDYIENYVPNEKQKNKRTNRQNTGKKVESRYSSISREELNLHNYPAFTELKNFKDKMILAMYIFNKENKGEYFTPYDILAIMPNIFGEKASLNQVNGIIRRNPSWFNKISVEEGKKNYKYKLLNDAIKYIEQIVGV